MGDADSEPKDTTLGKPAGAWVALARSFEFKLPLALLLAAPISSPAASGGNRSALAANRCRYVSPFSKAVLPVDSLPVEGWIELKLLSEDDLTAISI